MTCLACVVDGNDVLAVHEAVTEAVKRARKGQGPSLVECKTYRWRGHFEGDACTYRCTEELEEWMAKDPIPPFRVQASGEQNSHQEGSGKDQGTHCKGCR